MLPIDSINKNKASEKHGRKRLEVNFENLIVGRHVFIIFFILNKISRISKINSYVIN